MDFLDNGRNYLLLHPLARFHKIYRHFLYEFITLENLNEKLDQPVHECVNIIWKHTSLNAANQIKIQIIKLRSKK